MLRHHKTDQGSRYNAFMKKIFTTLPFFLLLSLVTLLMSCSEEKGVRSVYSSSHCQLKEADMKLLRNEGELKKVKQAHFSIQSLDDGAAHKKDSINYDLDSEHLIVVSMGQQSTAGYQLKLMKEQVKVKGSVLSLPLVNVSPEGAVVAQVLTTPCAVLAVEKGRYSAIEYGDKKISL